MVEKLHSQLPLGSEAAPKAKHYQEVIDDLKAMLQGKWVAHVYSKGSVSLCWCRMQCQAAYSIMPE
jgi:hypothetical protein